MIKNLVREEEETCACVCWIYQLNEERGKRHEQYRELDVSWPSFSFSRSDIQYIGWENIQPLCFLLLLSVA